MVFVVNPLKLGQKLTSRTIIYTNEIHGAWRTWNKNEGGIDTGVKLFYGPCSFRPVAEEEAMSQEKKEKKWSNTSD